jgi:hypothetical protein
MVITGDYLALQAEKLNSILRSVEIGTSIQTIVRSSCYPIRVTIEAHASGVMSVTVQRDL